MNACLSDRARSVERGLKTAPYAMDRGLRDGLKTARYAMGGAPRDGKRMGRMRTRPRRNLTSKTVTRSVLMVELKPHNLSASIGTGRMVEFILPWCSTVPLEARDFEALLLRHR